MTHIKIRKGLIFADIILTYCLFKSLRIISNYRIPVLHFIFRLIIVAFSSLVILLKVKRRRRALLHGRLISTLTVLLVGSLALNS